MKHQVLGHELRARAPRPSRTRNHTRTCTCAVFNCAAPLRRREALGDGDEEDGECELGRLKVPVIRDGCAVGLKQLLVQPHRLERVSAADERSQQGVDSDGVHLAPRRLEQLQRLADEPFSAQGREQDRIRVIVEIDAFAPHRAKHQQCVGHARPPRRPPHRVWDRAQCLEEGVHRCGVGFQPVELHAEQLPLRLVEKLLFVICALQRDRHAAQADHKRAAERRQLVGRGDTTLGAVDASGAGRAEVRITHLQQIVGAAPVLTRHARLHERRESEDIGHHPAGPHRVEHCKGRVDVALCRVAGDERRVGLHTRRGHGLREQVLGRAEVAAVHANVHECVDGDRVRLHAMVPHGDHDVHAPLEGTFPAFERLEEGVVGPHVGSHAPPGKHRGEGAQVLVAAGRNPRHGPRGRVRPGRTRRYSGCG